MAEVVRLSPQTSAIPGSNPGRTRDNQPEIAERGEPGEDEAKQGDADALAAESVGTGKKQGMRANSNQRINMLW